MTKPAAFDPNMAAALILCGGRSTRMGTPKETLTLGGLTLAARTVRAVSPLASHVLLVGNALVPGTTTISEPISGLGPMHAIAAGIDWLHVHTPQVTHVFVLSVDMPRLSTSALRALGVALFAVPEHPAVAALAVDDAERDQYLCALWQFSDLGNTIGRALQEKSRRLGTIYGDVPIVRVSGLGEAITDVDTPAQWAKVNGASQP